MLFKRENVESFEKITLTMSGMRAIDEYEVINTGDTVEISQYLRYYTHDENDRQLIKRTSYDTEKFIDFINECRIMKWNGFNGKNPPGVRDGYMFSFTAEVNNGTKIKASGSNNYPSNFSKFRQELTKILYNE